MIKEFSDVFLKDLPDKPPPMRDVQHNINLVLGASLSNLLHYRMNPTEHAELKREVNELMREGFSRESLSSCAVFALLTQKKDRSWRICVNSLAINKIMVVLFPHPYIDDLLDMMAGATIFSKIDLKSAQHQIHIHSGDEWKLPSRQRTNYMNGRLWPMAS